MLVFSHISYLMKVHNMVTFYFKPARFIAGGPI